MPSGSSPDNVKASVWHTPVAFISTNTSLSFGPSKSTSSIIKSLAALIAIAALVFIISPLSQSIKHNQYHIDNQSGEDIRLLLIPIVSYQI